MLWLKSNREISRDLLLSSHWCIRINSHANRVLANLRPTLPMAPDAILPYNRNCIVALSLLKSKTICENFRSCRWGNRVTLLFRWVRGNLAFPLACDVVAIRMWNVVWTQMCHETVMVPNTRPNYWRSSDWSSNGWPRYAKNPANAAVLRDARRATIGLPIVLRLVELRAVNLKMETQINFALLCNDSFFSRCLRWKIATKVSDILVVSSVSGNSRKYCFTMSAMSYACCKSNVSDTSPFDSSMTSFNFWMRDLTPDFRNIPTYFRIMLKNKLNGFVAMDGSWYLVRGHYLIQSIQSQPLQCRLNWCGQRLTVSLKQQHQWYAKHFFICKSKRWVTDHGERGYRISAGLTFIIRCFYFLNEFR